jgi:uncharacterized membrane protein
LFFDWLELIDMGFLAFVGVIVLIVLHVNLSGRVRSLERRLKEQAQPAEPPAAATPPLRVVPPRPSATPGADLAPEAASASVSPFRPAAAETATPPRRQGPQPEPGAAARFAAWLRQDWMLKLGALLLLIGFGWLATYAFLNDWIGPMGRIAVGLCAGTAFIILGWLRLRTSLAQGGVFLALGSGVILVTTFAARASYGFFSPLSALVVMFLSVCFVATASVVYRSRSLAMTSLVLAGVVPALTNAPESDHVGLFAYLLVVVAGAIWIVALTGWRSLTTVALVIIAIYSAWHFFDASPLADDRRLVWFAYAFSALFFTTNTLGILKRTSGGLLPDLLTAAGNGMFLLAWILAGVPEEWQSLAIALWMVLFAASAFWLFKITRRKSPFYVYAGVGIVMLAAATAVQLDGPALVIAYTLEGALVAAATQLATRNAKSSGFLGLLLAVPAFMSVESIDSEAWEFAVLHSDFFVLAVLAAALMGLGLFFLRDAATHAAPDAGVAARRFGAAYLVAGSVFACILLWLSLRAWLGDDNLAATVALVVYTLAGLVCYFTGLRRQGRGLRTYGGALVGFVVVRLLFVDIWKMELAGRITTFFLIGALLISTAFIGKKRKRHESDGND